MCCIHTVGGSLKLSQIAPFFSFVDRMEFDRLQIRSPACLYARKIQKIPNFWFKQLQKSVGVWWQRAA